MGVVCVCYEKTQALQARKSIIEVQSIEICLWGRPEGSQSGDGVVLNI